jgi:uncharacterized protein (DUF924 family)
LLPTDKSASFQPAPVLEFWFGVPPGPSRVEWFRKDEAFDARIRDRFGPLHEAASRRALDGWRAAPESMLALVVVLDQFSRNLYRGDARAFAQDAYALECANEAITRGDDTRLLPVHRQFLYLPLEHSEDIADQERCVELMRSLEVYPETKGLTEWAEKHRVIIARFGRFPHRNAALGRASTPEEIEFLKQPGSGF